MMNDDDWLMMQLCHIMETIYINYDDFCELPKQFILLIIAT